MKRRWKVLIGATAVLGILLAVNTIVLDQQSKAAGVTVSGGRILDLPGGGHSPNVEKPVRTSQLIVEFAAEVGSEGARKPGRGRRKR